MRYTFRPISDRTPFTGKHEPTPFRATWADTLEVLDRELTAIRGRDVVLELDLSEGQLRLDGMPRADAKIASPAVRIAFDSKHGPLTYATDRYDHRAWRDQPEGWKQNVRAIALGLEALRKVDRYGIVRRGEQYQGFKAIGGGAAAMPAAPSAMSPAEAEGVIRGVVGAFDRSEGSERIRRARVMAHPDRNNGDHDLAYRVDEAARVLGIQ